MNKALVIYRSKYGSAKQYAEWIAEALNGELTEERDVKPADFERYNIIVAGGCVRAGRVQGMQKLKLAVSRLQDKSMAFFAVCAMGGDGDYEKTLAERNVGARIGVPLFVLPGRVDFTAMGKMDRTMMKVIVGMLKKEQNLTPRQQALVDNIGGVCDMVDRAAVKPLIAAVRL